MKNLSDPVDIEFRINNNTYAKNCTCVFWDFEANGGLGRWSSNGCKYEFIGDGVARCSCNHLTHFAVLVVSIFHHRFFIFLMRLGKEPLVYEISMKNNTTHI